MSSHAGAVTLDAITSKTFLFLSTFRGSAGEITMGADEAVLALQSIWRETEASARPHPAVYGSFEKAKYLLVVCADELMRTAPGWEGAPQWPSQEAELYGTTIGGERFFELLDDPTYRTPELREVFFSCLALGFQGAHAGDRAFLADTRRKLRYQLEDVPADLSEKITPEAYTETQGEDFQAMPVANSARLFVVLTGVVLLLGVLAKVAYATSVSKLVDRADAIATPKDGLGSH